VRERVDVIVEPSKSMDDVDLIFERLQEQAPAEQSLNDGFLHRPNPFQSAVVGDQSEL